MLQSPRTADNVARSRYGANMKSNIFDPPPEKGTGRLIAGGKRRDQTTSEMFGDYEEKDLRPAPLTFVPKVHTIPAREAKQRSLVSQVMPATARSTCEVAMNVQPFDELRATKVLPAAPDFERDEVVINGLRRQQEMQSSLFGRPTPEANPSLRLSTRRLTPSDRAWHDHKEMPQDQDMTHGERAFKEKCSGIFNRASPDNFQGKSEAERRFKQEEQEVDARRRSDNHYSDLFGKPEARERHQQKSEPGPRKNKLVGHPEDIFAVHQDWTDVRTELLHSARGPRPEHPMLRKGQELHQVRIFGPREHAWAASTQRAAPMLHDNSEKVKGNNPAEVHQAMLRSSVMPDEFYQQARVDAQRPVAVADMFLTGLRQDANNNYLRSLCQGFDLQVVKAEADIDPVTNCCKGRAKVTVRYDPQRGDIGGLVHKFEASNMKVEM